jgi:serine/threonine-protein kinase
MRSVDLPAPFGDRYLLERELGRGGMATVYLARDLQHDRHVAVKVMFRELAASLGPERFQREIRVTALLDHPHILPVLDSGETADQLWYVMPYVDGESLRERLKREVQLPVPEAVRISHAVAQALDWAHRHGVVHRDIKPENILLSDGLARVADFGVAQAVEEAGTTRLTEAGLVMGTPAYMSPEQASGSRVTGQTDQYSLACVLYEMLAGEPPYTGPTAQSITFKRMSEPVPSVRRLREAVPPTLDVALARALAKVPADRYPTVAEFGAAAMESLTEPGTPRLSVAPTRHWRGILAAATLIGLVAAGMVVLVKREPAKSTLDANLIAVAPFDVMDPSLALWHEGLVDVLSRNLDGAGALRTVSPTIVVRRWSGRADPVSAGALGRSTGARLAIFGTLVPTGPDSVRLSATLLDVAEQRGLGEVEISDDVRRMTRLADSVTVALLRQLGRTRTTGGVSLGSLGTRSLPALKQFLQAEQHYRNGEWDAALVASEAAIALDSSFALAWRRAGWVIGWRDWDIPRMYTYSARAGALNRGLAPRDSFLVVLDSLFAVDGPASWAWARRLFDTGEAAVRRYPDDPELWQSMGEARAHIGGRPFRQVPPESTIAAFRRVLALDSSFVPAYPHLIGLEAALGETAQARQDAVRALSLSPTTPLIQLLAHAFTTAHADTSALERLLDSMPVGVLVGAGNLLLPWPDSAQTAVRVYEAASAKARTKPGGVSAEFFQSLLVYALAGRGRLRDAYRSSGGTDPFLLDQLAPLGILPGQAGVPVLPPSRTMSDPSPGMLLRWAEIGDTQALDRVTRMGGDSNRIGAFDAAYLKAAARAFASLARHDSATALQRMLAVPDSLCWGDGCGWVALTRARLLGAAGREQEAAERLGYVDMYADLWAPVDVLLLFERARLADAMDQPEWAARSYQYIANAWAPGDPELRRYVDYSQASLERLRYGAK